MNVRNVLVTSSEILALVILKSSQARQFCFLRLHVTLNSSCHVVYCIRIDNVCIWRLGSAQVVRGQVRIGRGGGQALAGVRGRHPDRAEDRGQAEGF